MIVPSVVLGQRAGAVPPSDKIIFGGIGIGARGAHDLSKLLNISEVRFVAICDVRTERREDIKSTVDQKYGDRGCQMYDDQYALLARQDIDAVLIATGDRWHTPLSIIAAQHGKDVYCEKPCSMSIEESWALAAAFRRYNRLYQAGCQRRNGANFELCKELLKSGALGKLQTLYANVGPSVNWPPLPSRDWLAAEELPPRQVLDWDRWLGPAPWRPYHSSYVRGGWRNFYDFHGGGILEWGTAWARRFDQPRPGRKPWPWQTESALASSARARPGALPRSPIFPRCRHCPSSNSSPFAQPVSNPPTPRRNITGFLWHSRIRQGSRRIPMSTSSPSA